MPLAVRLDFDASGVELLTARLARHLRRMPRDRHESYIKLLVETRVEQAPDGSMVVSLHERFPGVLG